MQLEDFHGWGLHAAWDDVCLGLKPYRDFDRIAMVGGRKWERWLAAIWKSFTTAKVRYFGVSEADAAWKWIGEG